MILIVSMIITSIIILIITIVKNRLIRVIDRKEEKNNIDDNKPRAQKVEIRQDWPRDGIWFILNSHSFCCRTSLLTLGFPANRGSRSLLYRRTSRFISSYLLSKFLSSAPFSLSSSSSFPRRLNNTLSHCTIRAMAWRAERVTTARRVQRWRHVSGRHSHGPSVKQTSPTFVNIVELCLS